MTRKVNHMKALICALLLLASGAANALTLTITVNDAQETRIRTAVGKAIGKDTPATRVEVVAFLARYLRQTVQQVELREAQIAVPVPAEVDAQ
jgi:hypothetical protein